MSYDKLIVVTSASWVARELAGARTLPVEHSIGLDIPDLDGAALWCSGSWATRLLKSGIEHPFLSVGPDWLPRVPAEFLRRKVWASKLFDLPYPGPVEKFYKLAEHKHSGIPAGVRLGRGIFQRQIGRAFEDGRGIIPDLTGLHIHGSDVMSYRDEYRCFIAHEKVTAASFYLSTVAGINGEPVHITWDAYADRVVPPTTTEAKAFAQKVVDAMGDDQPPGYTLDVGVDTEGNWSVIEANAAWSSNPYLSDSAGVIKSVLASQEPGHNQWRWRPDQVFLDRSRPLPTTTGTSKP